MCIYVSIAMVAVWKYTRETADYFQRVGMEVCVGVRLLLFALYSPVLKKKKKKSM